MPKTPRIKPTERRATRGLKPTIQLAALPWRRTAEGQVEILLITSRDTRRWIIPKGWPIKNKSAAKTAAREAFEEAGMRGKIGKSPIGAYVYEKRLSNGASHTVKVSVFALRVEKMETVFPESGQRDLVWLSPGEAATRVDEPQLSELLTEFPALAEAHWPMAAAAPTPAATPIEPTP